MSVRPLDVLDFPLIARYRNDALTLNSTRALTRGNPLGMVALMAYMNPARNMYAAVVNGEGATLIGGVNHTRGEPFARLLYLAPTSLLGHALMPELVEDLVARAGSWGALHVTAEVDENSDAFVALRQAGFSVYAWQRMWEISEINGDARAASAWIRSRAVNVPRIQNLHHQIVPPLVQPVEPISKNVRGFICAADSGCFVSLVTGAYGIVALPLIHPETTNVAEKIKALMSHLPERRNRPVYMLVRSYQTWLEPVLEDLGAKPGGRQAVMVKHMTRRIKEEQPASAVPSGVSVQPSRVNGLQVKEGE
ncbi:MAG: hypothetical protein Kow002_08130 [Anaerolineales bacterium]